FHRCMLLFDFFMLQYIQRSISHHGVEVRLHAGMNGQIFLFLPNRHKCSLDYLFGFILILDERISVVTERLVKVLKNHLKSSYVARLQGSYELICRKFHCFEIHEQRNLRDCSFGVKTIVKRITPTPEKIIFSPPKFAVQSTSQHPI